MLKTCALLVLQVIQLFKDAFLSSGLDLYLVPYRVIPNRTGPDRAPGNPACLLWVGSWADTPPLLPRKVSHQ
jgi:hypothetical protein